jgi:hypothetical protein
MRLSNLKTMSWLHMKSHAAAAVKDDAQSMLYRKLRIKYPRSTHASSFSIAIEPHVILY